MAGRAARGLGRAALVLTGFVMGLLGIGLGAWFYLQAARIDEARTGVGADVRVARESMERVDPDIDQALRFDLADVVLRGDAGDTVLASRELTMALDAASLEGDGAIEFFDVRLRDPVAHIIQSTAGDWNYERALGLTEPAPPDAEPGRPMHFRDVRLEDGRVSIALPAGPPPEEGAAFVANLPLATIGGTPYNVYRVAEVEGTLPFVRIGGTQGWRTEFSGLSGAIEQPDMRFAAATGWAEQAGATAVEFDVESLAIGESSLAGSGLITFADEGLLYDVDLRGEPLLLADFQPLFPNLPAEGSARFGVDVQSLTPERLALDFRELDVDALDSRIVGSVGVAVGGEVPLALRSANLELAPLRLSALEELGFAEELPVVGEITGRVTGVEGNADLADVDLTATLRAATDPTGNPSVVVAEGTVALGDGLDALALDGMSIALRPLRLETFAGVAPERAEILRGTVEGAVLLAGTMDDARITDGSLSYAVDDVPPTRLTGISGRVSTTPELEYELAALAQPLEMATLTALFPAAPLRPGRLNGPLSITGDAEAVALSADLTGPAGGIEFNASAILGEPLAFDISGSVDAFAAGMLLQPDMPVEGPLSGTFSARGTTDDLEFDVDLAQLDGRFVLNGAVDLSAEPPRVSLAGDVVDFRVGALVGDPRLFPGPMTGPVTLSGGAGQPYSFDFGLRGEESELVLTGSYQPGPIPVYEASGSVAGLDLSRLPMGGLPTSTLTATIDVQGRGIDLETIEGTYAFDATPSTVAARPLDAALGRVHVRDGVAYIDTLLIEYDRARFAATGTWGLRAPSVEPLRYSLSSPDLAALSRLMSGPSAVPLRIGGSFESGGTIAGSLEYPIIDGTFEGADLRYEDLRAASLSADIDARRDPAVGWSGELALNGTELDLPGGEELQLLELQASGSESTIGFDVLARRTNSTQLVADGSVELVDLSPQALTLREMQLDLDGAIWSLIDPTEIRFTADEGAWIDNLVLNRTGTAPGSIAIDGRIPPTGAADLTIATREVDLSDLNRLSPAFPAIQGILTMDALLSGQVDDPEMVLRGEVRELGFEGATAESLSFDGSYEGELLTGDAEATAAGAPLFGANFSIPMRLSFQNMLPVFEGRSAAPLAVSVVADSLPLDLVAALVPGVRDGSGVTRAMAEIGGTLDAPTLAGWARVDGGGLFIEPLNVRYSEIEADLVLEQNRLQLNSFSARSDGTLVVSGAVNFPPELSPRLAISVGLDDFRVIDDPEVASVGVSGQLRLDGSAEDPVLTGDMSIRESTIRVPELAQPEPGIEIAYADAPTVGPESTDPVPVGPPFLGNLRIDGVELSVDESVWLESNEMRVQIAGDLVLYRVGEDLRVFGALQAARGTYALEISAIEREFDVLSGRVQFFGTGDLNPSLDIVAAYRTRGTTVGRGGDVTILVQLAGTLLSPRVQLSADTPVPMSETDIISYLIFGQPSFELGGAARRFAEQIFVQELVSGIIASELERPILRAGLCDWVRVRPGLSTNLGNLFGRSALSNAAIECGWEIGPDLFLTGQTGIAGFIGGEFTEGRLGVEWQIDSQWLWQASYGSVDRNPLSRIFDTGVRTQFSTDIRRQWEYGRPRDAGAIDLSPESTAENEPPAIPASAEMGP